ncbi:MAG: ATP-binding protein [Polaromonas sp.]|nr:ATP-binding protein [Polaromonas sp.]
MAIHIRSAQLLSVPGNGYTEPPLRADEQALAGSWRTVALPNIAERELVVTPDARIRTVTDWYRIDLGALQPTTAARHLYLPRWKTIGQLAVYGDGRLLYSSHGSMAHNGYNHPLLLQLNAAADERPPAVVMLRIDRLQGGGSALSTVWAGSEKPLVWRYQVRQVLQTQLPFVLSAAFLTVGIFALAVWVRLRRDSLYLLFFVISAVAFIRTLHYHVGGSYLPINDEWFEWISIASLMWLMVLSHCFMERLHENPMRGLTPTLLVVTALVNVMTMPGFFTLMPQLTLFAPLLYMLMLPFALLIFLDALRNGFRMNSREVWLMAGWLVSATLCCFYDLALQSNWVSPEGLYTNPYAIIGMFVMFLYIMFRRYVGAMSEVEQANANLAQRLQSREAELVTSYERLREIERRQTLSNERLRLTQDMHDGLGSSLVTALRVVESGRMTDSELGAILKSCIDDLKLTIDSMEPVDADLLLLLATLRFRLGPRLTAAGISLKWEVRDLPRLEWLNPRSALHILRTLQEAFANILKHTRATEIRVRTSVEGDGVQVTIGDNGQGFDVEETLRSHTGSGLGNQQRRVQSIGGRVNWTSDATGTCLTLWLPLRPPFPAAAE